MDKDLLVDGRSYISAVRAGKKVGYASDYIGQLCRGNKIPGKLIGRTWYVDILSLLEHKKESKTRKRRRVVRHESLQNNLGPKTTVLADEPFVPLSSRSDYAHPLAYEAEAVSPLPQLLSKASFHSARHAHTARRQVLALTALAVGLVVSLSWFGFIYQKNISTQVITRNAELLAANFASDFAHFVGKQLSLAREKLLGKSEGNQNTMREGLVVLPSGGDSKGVIAKVKRAFSDTVKVAVDEDGTSGVITPVFREGDSSEQYIFVMVPLSEDGASRKTN